MKATITRADGTKVELEGLTDDVVKALQALSPAQIVSWPTQWQPWPPPYAPQITWEITS